MFYEINLFNIIYIFILVTLQKLCKKNLSIQKSYIPIKLKKKIFSFKL